MSSEIREIRTSQTICHILKWKYVRDVHHRLCFADFAYFSFLANEICGAHTGIHLRTSEYSAEEHPNQIAEQLNFQELTKKKE